MYLYRPVGAKELECIVQTEYTAFPPRLREQPIFYPVLIEEYAKEIASKWNAKDPVSGYAGYVTKFEVDDRYLEKFSVHQVGAKHHLEYWIPAEELDEFNQHIIGTIQVIQEFVKKSTFIIAAYAALL